MRNSRGQTRTETTSIRRSSPSAWARGQSMVEMAIIAPIAVAGLLMWIELNNMTGTQHRLMAAVYEGTKVISQFSDLFITECMDSKNVEKKVKEMCKDMIPADECNAHFHESGRADHSADAGADLTAEQKEQILSSLDDLLTRKTLCQTMEDRTQQSMNTWNLTAEQESPFTFLHYYKDENGNEYDKVAGLPDDSEIREYVGIQATYPHSFSFGNSFGITSYEAKSVTLLHVFRTPPSGGGSSEGPCGGLIDRPFTGKRIYCN